MILYLNTTKNNQVTVAVIGKNKSSTTLVLDKLAKVAAESKYDLAEKLPGLIAKAVVRAGVKFANLEAIAVVRGPGLFSRLRTAIVAANALAFALGIKVIPLSVNDKLGYAALINKKRLSQVLPLYGKLPNITLDLTHSTTLRVNPE